MVDQKKNEVQEHKEELESKEREGTITSTEKEELEAIRAEGDDDEEEDGTEEDGVKDTK